MYDLYGGVGEYIATPIDGSGGGGDDEDDDFTVAS